MHPIERLRYIARSYGGDPRTLVVETASALRALGADPAGLVVACRRIVERHPTSGPLWWLCAHMLTDTDPWAVARRLASEIADDPTADQLADALPLEATVCVVGWSDLIGEALLRREDLSVLAVGVDDSADLLTGAVLAADVVLIEALAASPTEMLAVPGARAAASVAYCSEVPVWAIVGVGRRIPDVGFQSLVGRIPNQGVADVVPLALCSEFSPNDAGCPVALELTRI
ncbi:MAG: hypothetical protein K8R99_11675 [Actinomycetia bacterium]|nr:hypothetical protein [Actinomycetes bacterium]